MRVNVLEARYWGLTARGRVLKWCSSKRWSNIKETDQARVAGHRLGHVPVLPRSLDEVERK
jgi:hypothetical protein